MRAWQMRIIGAAALATFTLLGADAPKVDLQAFVGVWRESAARSHRVQSAAATYSFTAQPDGTLVLASRAGSAPATKTIIHLDGKERPVADAKDVVSVWMIQRSGTYEQVTKRAGKPIRNVRWTVTPNGQTATVEDRAIDANGRESATQSVLTRVAGNGATLIGTWKASGAAPLAAWVIRYDAAPDGTVRYSNSVTGVSYAAKLDGKEYPVSGPQGPTGVQVTLRPAGGRKIFKLMRQGGRTIAESTVTVSADGKSMTDSGRAGGQENEQVYEKQ